MREPLSAEVNREARPGVEVRRQLGDRGQEGVVARDDADGEATAEEVIHAETDLHSELVGVLIAGAGRAARAEEPEGEVERRDDAHDIDGVGDAQSGVIREHAARRRGVGPADAVGGEGAGGANRHGVGEPVGDVDGPAAAPGRLPVEVDEGEVGRDREDDLLLVGDRRAGERRPKDEESNRPHTALVPQLTGAGIPPARWLVELASGCRRIDAAEVVC